MSFFVVPFILALLSALIIEAQDSAETCIFEDGIQYAIGENVGASFTTRCGNSTEWSCFCDPSLEYQVYCPFCGFSAGDGSFYCGADGETISFQDGSIVRVCSCEFTADPAADPIRNCTIQEGGLPSFPISAQCVFPDADGNLLEFENGESFGDLIEGACGPASEWPSFCRVLDEQGAFDWTYPYCVYNDVNSGEILCANDGETVSYIDANNAEKNCTCIVTSEGVPEPDCGEAAPTVAAPSEPPTSPSNGTSPTPAPAPSGGTGSPPTAPPTLSLLPAGAHSISKLNVGMALGGFLFLSFILL
mmetsp:Transcript_20327/g.32735  ORF Transcript_20327/g.32735 Transcript_20327/m.32735 type:complete len:304 (+) Transcript_20327:189-1100(+)